MAELINPSSYNDFTLQALMTPDGITRLNSILSQLSQNIAGDSETVRVFQGVGTPEGSIAAGVGSIYMRTDGGTDTSLYRKESGSDNTGWVAIKAPASLPLSVANGGTGSDLSATTSGKILYFSSTGVIAADDVLTVIPKLSRISLFTADGTFVAPAGITKVYVSMCGGGGGGGTAGGGGTNGSDGGATSFDSVLSANGGTGGGDQNGNPSGSCAGGTVPSLNASTTTAGVIGNRIAGGNGAQGDARTTGGGGGASCFGSGGATNSGAGGIGGGGGGQDGSNAGGGGGGGASLIMCPYTVVPGNSYTVTIGTGGTGGGTGGSGICILIY